MSFKKKYNIKLHPKVSKFLEKSDKSLKERIVKKLKSLKENPFCHLEHFEGKNYYKLRIGTYRALIDIDFEEKVLFVQVLDHRSKIYKR
jgi:mRNA-degrading endonuclease RelE of RelBE toxin-antitoxin system